ncbi:MAG: hypothetical protein HQM11_13975 [SAR324 cluster bacterium]|nr:hypothetical protein [SAR324 cluster bacterium]
MLWFKLALREIRNNFRFTSFFVFNAALGLIGFILLVSFRMSMTDHLALYSKRILTADVSVSAYSPFTEAELKLIRDMLGPEAVEARQISFFSMISSPQHSSLVQVIAVSDNFPHYGAIVLEAGNQETVATLNQRPHVWVYPELLVGLEIGLGDSMHIGNAEFQTTGSILDDPTNAISNFSFAPRLYMGIEQVEQTGFFRKGSRISYHYLYKLPPEVSVEELEKQLTEALKQEGMDEKIRVRTHLNAGEQIERVLGYVNDYLGMIALIALFLAGVGTAYLFRGFLGTRFKDLAIFLSIGATRYESYLVIVGQIALMGLTASVFSVLLSWGLLPILPGLLQGVLPGNFAITMPWSSVGIALLIGTLGSVFFCLPVLVRIHGLNPSSLFREHVSHDESRVSWRYLISYVPVIALFWGLAIWQGKSVGAGSLFVGLLALAILLLGLLAWGLFHASLIYSRKRTVLWKIAMRNLSRNKIAAISCFLAMSLGAMLLNLIPQIHQGLQEEIQQPEGLTLPSFFLIDIQEEQLAEVSSMLEQEGHPLSNISPMIRSRVELINQKPFVPEQPDAEVSEEQLEYRRNFRRWGGNLSYREELADSEKIVEGTSFSGRYQENAGTLPEVSVDFRFAEKTGLRIGDSLTFDVQGIMIEARVVNFRRVRWNSFQPNFYILFQPGVLDDAPKVFLASLNQIAPDQKTRLQARLARQFPNISMIDVTKAVSKILQLTAQMSLALKFMAYLSIVVGLIVVFSIARHEIRSRLWEINLMKVLGTSFRDLLQIVQIEFGLLGFGASLFGVLLSLGMSYVVSWILFERIWNISWGTTLISVFGIGGLSMMIALFATFSMLRQKPLELLKSV